MADQRILYTEELVGANHATKADTLNRLTLVEHNNDGTHIPVTFSANRNAVTQSIPATTITKVQYISEDWDTHTYFDATVNNRFTPLIAGYYMVSISGRLAAVAAGYLFYMMIYKNGAIWKQKIKRNNTGVSADVWNDLSCLLYLNGSTDYIEHFVYCSDTTGRSLSGNADDTYFQAALIR